jgi:lysophospholipase L1-like esterase
MTGNRLKGRGLLICSLALNVLLIGSAGLYVIHKGGLAFVMRKAGLEKTELPLLPFQKQVEDFQAALPVGPEDSVFLGDSITADAPVADYFTHIQKRGIGSEISSAIQARLGAILKGHPAKLFLMAGTNDVCRDIGVDETAKNVAEILDQIAAKSPRTAIYVMSVPPINQHLRQLDFDPSPLIPELNRKIESLCKERHVVFIDNYTALGDGNGQLKADYTWDGIHLTAAGYSRLMSLLAPYGPGTSVSVSH